VTYREVDGLSDEEYLVRGPSRLEAMLPGHPNPDEYRLGSTSVYRIHNRRAEKFRVGRVLLVADAAYICVPWGGYGCMKACIDVGGLADCLVGGHQGKVDENILDLYSEIRREKFLRYEDVRSIKNMERISTIDLYKLLKTDKFMRLLKDLEGDSEKTKQFILVRTFHLWVFDPIQPKE
jgi:2-polyprenyl-6-methoxyphenol hydroxylase-like FAD-dependent oxidoreductase